jgi:hypothetical protein
LILVLALSEADGETSVRVDFDGMVGLALYPGFISTMISNITHIPNE